MNPPQFPRRTFLRNSVLAGAVAGLTGGSDLPLFHTPVRAANALGGGKKILYIFLLGGNDALNTLIPIQDPAYATSRPTVGIPKQGGLDYASTGACFDPTRHVIDPGTGYDPSSAATRDTNDPTYGYASAIRTGNGFTALHPSLKFLAPVYNAGQLALIHRVAYPRQNVGEPFAVYDWQTAMPGLFFLPEGVWCRTIRESGATSDHAFTGISFQNQSPVSLLGGSGCPPLNLIDPSRLRPLGLPATIAGRDKSQNAISNAQSAVFPPRKNREFLKNQYQAYLDALPALEATDFSEAGNTFVDGNFPAGQTATDNDTAAGPYYMFPTTLAKNGGYSAHGNAAAKQVVSAANLSFFTQLKNAALMLGRTDAFIATTELGGFARDLSYGVVGNHADALKAVGWSLYALSKFFSNPTYSPKCSWNDVAVVVASEFGRITAEDVGGEIYIGRAGAMLVAGGSVKGYNNGLNRSGVFACHSDPAKSTYNGNVVNWITGNAGSMFEIGGSYLSRAVDFRSVYGEIIREHLGATPAQLNRIIPGYANESTEHLQFGGDVTPPPDAVTTKIAGELDII